MHRSDSDSWTMLINSMSAELQITPVLLSQRHTPTGKLKQNVGQTGQEFFL